ncbi:MAG: hypothetical protein WAN86_21125 [Hyphomicrobiaceae bacterium]
MSLRRALALTAAVLLLAPMARSGHEQPIYPSYYPHEIEIAAAVDPQAAGELLGKGKLHAYVGGAPSFTGAAPKGVASAPSLGALLVVRLNASSALVKDEASACAAVGAIVRELATKGGDVVAHPYPVTPWHGDYLHHADLAEAALARFGGAAPNAPAVAGLKVRAEGALAQSLVRPEWRAEGDDWNVAIAAVDAGQLVVSATVRVNGWMGPRWARSGWFHAYRLLADTIADPEARQRVEVDAARLRSGDIANAAERANLERDLVRRLTAGCRGAVAGYTVKREFYNATFSDGIENLAPDALEGLNSPMFLRTVKLKDFPWNGWLKLGTPVSPRAAWNPVGGFGDGFGRLMWSAIGDPTAIPSPYGHGWVLNRISEVKASPR